MHPLTGLLVFATLCLVACSGPVVVAHRGASAEAPENTVAAFELAVEQGARHAECDVHLALDGSVIVIHDATLERTTDGEGRVDEREGSEIRALDAGSWKGADFAGEPVPDLPALLRAVGDDLHVLVEVKAGVGIIPKIAEALEADPPRAGVTIISFDDAQVREAAMRLPKVRRFILRRKTAEPFDATDLVAAAREAKAHGVGLDHEGVDAAIVEALHAEKLEVYVWTVNEADAIDAMVEAGVDGFMTDHPRLGLERVDAARRR